MRQFGAARLTRATWHTWLTAFEGAGDQPEFAVLASAYTVQDGHVTFKRPVDLLAIDRRRAEIGLPPLESDIKRRAQGDQLSPAGADRADPWPG